MKAQDSLNPYNHSIAFAYTPSRVFHNRVIQPDEDLGPDAFHALQKRAYRSETGLNDYDPKKSLDERDCKTYTLKDISRYPGLENLKDESIECTHSGLRELSLLYRIGVNDTIVEFIQKTGMMPSAFVNYFMALEQTGVKTKIIPALTIDLSIKEDWKKTNYDFGFFTCSDHARNYFPILEQPIEYGSFLHAPIALPRVPEAIFMSIKKFDYFALVHSSCRDFDIGDRTELHIKRFFIYSNSHLKELPNVTYTGLKEVRIRHCLLLTHLPEDFYDREGEFNITIENCPHLKTTPSRLKNLILE